MKLPHIRRRRIRLALGAGTAATVLAFLGATAVTNAQAAETTAAGTTAAGTTAAGTTAAGTTAAGTTAAATTWSGTFDGFPSSSWKSSWGVVSSGQFGFDRMDPLTGGGLKVLYGKGSSAPSCTNCPTAGGAQFYTNLNNLGRANMASSKTLSLKYQLKFPAGHDFGKGGKLPGLYGGSPGEASGGNHGNAWSTRFMFRNGNKGEIYFYSPDGDGYGKDLGLGKWTYPADDQYHTIEQFVDRTKETTTVWFDGRQVFSTSTKGISGINFSGVFFSTFYGGHSTEWGPKKTSYAWFKGFSLSTAVQH